MEELMELDLQYFTEGEAAAPTGETAGTGAETTGAEGPIQAGDTLADGTRVQSAQVAAAMEKQMRRHPELRQVYGRKGQPAPQTSGQGQPGTNGAQDADADLRARWEEAKKGEFAQFYGEDVQSAIKDRFKNQADLKAAMDKLEPALQVLRERAGVETNDDLVNHIMDDDSLYEEAANEAGMTVEGYKQFMAYKAEHDEHVKAEAEYQRREAVNQHYQGLVRQAEEFKKVFPRFDLNEELKNKQFLRLTSPAVGLSIEDAYHAVHHRELGAQQMAYGMQRAQRQMAQTIMANGNRPREGGMGTQAAAPDVKINPRGMSRKERDAIRARIHGGAKGVTFD